MSDLGIGYLPYSNWSVQPDVVLVAVPDDQIIEVAQSIDPNITIIVPSGSFDMGSVEIPHKIVIWGIYSFLHGVEIDYRKIPFCIESSSEESAEQLQKLMAPWHSQLYLTNSSQRTAAHLAAVMANNFTTALYQIAFEIIDKEQLPSELLIATIQQLAEKLSTEHPNNLQTGPAKRNDLNTINKHLNLLNDEPNQQEVYRVLSNIILTKYGHSKL
jgi:predicted short-subunit dehydrogenase-like oxidoreductase (DUF2520 family)